VYLLLKDQYMRACIRKPLCAWILIAYSYSIALRRRQVAITAASIQAAAFGVGVRGEQRSQLCEWAS
jgi:hypothetical protein